MMLRPCLGVEGIPCGQLTHARRCPTHARLWEKRRPSRRALGRYDNRYVKLRDLVLREHPWCSLCGGAPTDADPLQVDHIVPLAWGGKNVKSNLQAAHRSCNAAKRDRMVSGV